MILCYEEAVKKAKKQGYPSYFDGDYICNCCGEPWELYFIFNEMDEKEKDKFLNGKGCPCCPIRPKL